MNYYIFEQLCKEKGTTPTAIALKLGLSKGNTTSWKKGGNPSVEILLQLADELNCTTDYLLTGKEKYSSSELSEDEQELITFYNKLPPLEKVKLVARAEAIADVYEEQVEEPKPPILSIYCSQNRVSAGVGEELYDYEQWDTIEVIETPQSRKADFVLTIDGDSMEPNFHDGDHILVRQQPAVDLGQIGIFSVDGKGYIKKYDGDRLVSFNPRYKDIPLANTESRCFGLVLGIAELA